MQPNKVLEILQTGYMYLRHYQRHPTQARQNLIRKGGGRLQETEDNHKLNRGLRHIRRLVFLTLVQAKQVTASQHPVHLCAHHKHWAHNLSAISNTYGMNVADARLPETAVV
jgi:hypothetical protein